MLNDMEEFDYKGAIAELEAILTKVEDPSTGLDDIDRLIKRSEELVTLCRRYLRTARERMEKDAE